MTVTMTRVLPFVSSQGRYPRGDDPWVGAAGRALARLDPQRNILLSSLGLPSWDLITTLGSRLGFNLELVLAGVDPGLEQLRTLLAAYGLEPSRVTAVWTGGPEGKAGWTERDRRLCERAELFLPLSLRPGGRLEALFAEFSPGREVEAGFRVPWSRRNWRPRYDFTGKTPDPATDKALRGRLIHWTHACAGPWPGEYFGRFYADLLDNPDHYVRDSAATLARIVAEGRLRGTSLHMPGNRPGVSFTSLDLSAAVSLMRWRMRYLRYSIEPFGITFERGALEAAGVRPVRYLGLKETPPSDPERFFTQSRGARTLWSQEAEWRLAGDLDLHRLPPGAATLIAADPESAGKLSEIIHGACEVLPLFRERVGE